MSENSFREKRLAQLAERRKARTADYGPSYRLTIPDNVVEYLKSHDLVPRWINDNDSGRIYDKTQRDTWDFLTNVEVSDDPRNATPGDERISRRVGTKEDGSPLLTYLCVKPRKWFEEDAASGLSPMRKPWRKSANGRSKPLRAKI